MAPVNGKIVQALNQEFSLASEVDFKNYTHEHFNNYQNNSNDINGTIQNGNSTTGSNRSSNQNGILHNAGLNNGNLRNGDLNNGNLRNSDQHNDDNLQNGKLNGHHKIENDDENEETLIINKIIPLYTGILDAIGENTNRSGIRKTPERAAKAIRFFTKGYQQTVAGI